MTVMCNFDKLFIYIGMIELIFNSWEEYSIFIFFIVLYNEIDHIVYIHNKIYPESQKVFILVGGMSSQLLIFQEVGI